MRTTNLRKLRGSDMAAVERRVVAAKARGRTRGALKELLAQRNPRAPRTKEEREWLHDRPVGRELI